MQTFCPTGTGLLLILQPKETLKLSTHLLHSLNVSVPLCTTMNTMIYYARMYFNIIINDQKLEMPNEMAL